MHYLANIRPGSAIDIQWRQLGRRGGQASGIIFVLTEKGYESRDQLSTEQVAAASTNESIVLVMTGIVAPTSLPDNPDETVPPTPITDKPKTTASRRRTT